MTKAGENMRADPLRVKHADLERYRDTESPYRKLCPACRKGAMMVHRDPGSMVLSSVDRCTWCGQTVVYSDAFINGEPVAHAENDPS
jgi:uncharacterized protein (DUF983 family)